VDLMICCSGTASASGRIGADSWGILCQFHLEIPEDFSSCFWIFQESCAGFSSTNSIRFDSWLRNRRSYSYCCYSLVSTKD